MFAALGAANAGHAAPPEPLLLNGHKGWVSGVAFSPDGKRLATASADGTVKFWDAATGTELRTLEAHEDIVSAVAYSTDGTQFATASFDGTAKVWSADKLARLHTFKGARGALLTVAFNPNCRALAAGGIDGSVRVWELDGKGEPGGRVQRRHDSWVNGIAYRPDGEGLASASSDNEIRFNPGFGQLNTLRPKIGEVRSVAFSADGTLIAAGTRYGVTKVWDAKTGEDAATLKGKRTGDVWGVAFSRDGKLLAAGDGDWKKSSDAVLWDAKTWKERARLPHADEVLCLAFHPTKSVLAVGARDRSVKLWDVAEVLKDKR